MSQWSVVSSQLLSVAPLSCPLQKAAEGELNRVAHTSCICEVCDPQEVAHGTEYHVCATQGSLAVSRLLAKRGKGHGAELRTTDNKQGTTDN